LAPTARFGPSPRRIRKAALLLLAGGLWTGEGGRVWADPVRKMQAPPAAVLSRGRVEKGIPGLSAAVWFRGRVAWEGAFGLADVENDVPVGVNTVFRIASISKSLTAAALLRLSRAGKIDLDAPIGRYVPSFPRKRWTVTPRLLLGHLAGIRHYKKGEIFLTRPFPDLASTLSLFAGDPLLFEPGTRYSYSTYGFNLLGRAVERVSGKSFFRALWDLVLEPAGMVRTFRDDQGAILRFRARGYRRDRRGRLLNCRLADTSNKVPGGGLVSTAEDLCRFAGALLTGRLLDRPLLEEAWTSQKTREGKVTGYGMGFQVKTWKGEKEVGHTGGQPGTSTVLYILPRKKIAVAILGNLEGRNLWSLAREAARVFLARREKKGAPPSGKRG